VINYLSKTKRFMLQNNKQKKALTKK
jgi:hypothetical protein